MGKSKKKYDYREKSNKKHNINNSNSKFHPHEEEEERGGEDASTEGIIYRSSLYLIELTFVIFKVVNNFPVTLAMWVSTSFHLISSLLLTSLHLVHFTSLHFTLHFILK